jgi:energy-coupling factor transporter ATP-binding protein EcfA2
VKALLSLVKRHRIVLLDGESGCGKSALISAGLVPALRAEADGLLPIHVASWGAEPVPGPMASVLEALSGLLGGGGEVRDRLGQGA